MIFHVLFTNPTTANYCTFYQGALLYTVHLSFLLLYRTSRSVGTSAGGQSDVTKEEHSGKHNEGEASSRVRNPYCLPHPCRYLLPYHLARIYDCSPPPRHTPLLRDDPSRHNSRVTTQYANKRTVSTSRGWSHGFLKVFLYMIISACISPRRSNTA